MQRHSFLSSVLRQLRVYTGPGRHTQMTKNKDDEWTDVVLGRTTTTVDKGSGPDNAETLTQIFEIPEPDPAVRVYSYFGRSYAKWRIHSCKSIAAGAISVDPRRRGSTLAGSTAMHFLGAAFHVSLRY